LQVGNGELIQLKWFDLKRRRVGKVTGPGDGWQNCCANSSPGASLQEAPPLRRITIEERIFFISQTGISCKPMLASTKTKL
jgi:hypothetical protein